MSGHGEEGLGLDELRVSFPNLNDSVTHSSPSQVLRGDVPTCVLLSILSNTMGPSQQCPPAHTGDHPAAESRGGWKHHPAGEEG